MHPLFNYRIRPFYLLTVILILLVISGCQSEGSSASVEPTDIPFTPTGLLELINEDGTVITSVAIEIAQGDSARARGLMERKSLPARGGMLFFDNEEREQTFWMKNTLIPLDIIFISADSQVVNIAKRTKPLSEERVSSTGPAQFVLEVRAGFADSYNLDETTRVRWRLLKD